MVRLIAGSGQIILVLRNFIYVLSKLLRTSYAAMQLLWCGLLQLHLGSLLERSIRLALCVLLWGSAHAKCTSVCENPRRQQETPHKS